MPKTLVDIPEELLAEAMTLMGTKTKAETVRQALDESVRRRQTPAQRLARRLDVVYSDIPVELNSPPMSQALGEYLIEELRKDDEAEDESDPWTHLTQTS